MTTQSDEMALNTPLVLQIIDIFRANMWWYPVRGVVTLYHRVPHIFAQKMSMMFLSFTEFWANIIFSLVFHVVDYVHFGQI